MTTPTPPPSPFKPKTPRVPLPPIAPFDPSQATKPVPAGHYLLIRGVQGSINKPSVSVVADAAEKIRSSVDPVAGINLIHTRLHFTSAPRNKATSSVYVRLSEDTPLADGEPRVDILDEWLVAFRAFDSTWECVWAPQSEKDKRMWVRILAVWADKDKDKEEDEKVITSLRKAIDTAIGPTCDAFRMGQQAAVVFHFPKHVDDLLRAGTISIPHLNKEYNVARVRQIDVHAAFEIVVGGFRQGYNDESNARSMADSWFNAVTDANGERVLVDIRLDVEEPDFVIYSFTTWAAAAHILSPDIRLEFSQQVGTRFGLTDPGLLYHHNCYSVYKKDVATALNDGAKAVDSSINALAKRMDKYERDARARDTETKTQLNTLSATVSNIAASTNRLAVQQQEMARGMLIMGRENELTSRIARIDAKVDYNRQILRQPADSEELEDARQQIRELAAQRAELETKLDNLRGDPSTPLITAGPSIAAPVAATPPTPSGAKRRRTSAHGPDASDDDAHETVANPAQVSDVEMNGSGMTTP